MSNRAQAQINTRYVAPKKGAQQPSAAANHAQLNLREGQSVALLQALHILTPDGRINQDSRRKLKQVNHLLQFIEPLLTRVQAVQGKVTLVDHGAGKSYLGFMLYDLFFNKTSGHSVATQTQVIGVEVRDDLVTRSQALAQQFGFTNMSFLNLSVAQSSAVLPQKIDIVTALHACDTATDDAIAFALSRDAEHVVLVPCCQAEVAAHLRENRRYIASSNPLAELWRRPLHTREFGSQLTNVLRCLQLESHGYDVTVTELVGWEHSMKNELIVASKRPDVQPAQVKLASNSAAKLQAVLEQTGLRTLRHRFFTPLLQEESALNLSAI